MYTFWPCYNSITRTHVCLSVCLCECLPRSEVALTHVELIMHVLVKKEEQSLCEDIYSSIRNGPCMHSAQESKREQINLILRLNIKAYAMQKERYVRICNASGSAKKGARASLLFL